MTSKMVRVQVVVAVQPDGRWSALGEKSLDHDWHIRSLSDGAKPGTVFHTAWINLPIPPKPSAKEAGRLTEETTP